MKFITDSEVLRLFGAMEVIDISRAGHVTCWLVMKLLEKLPEQDRRDLVDAAYRKATGVDPV